MLAISSAAANETACDGAVSTKSNEMPEIKDDPTRLRQIETQRTPVIESGTPGTPTSNERGNTTDGEIETQLTASLTPSIASGAAKLNSLSLIDDTATHLSGLMKSIGSDSSSPERVKRDPAMVNAACNCAKNIYQLMRLKLDVLKELRK